MNPSVGCEVRSEATEVCGSPSIIFHPALAEVVQPLESAGMVQESGGPYRKMFACVEATGGRYFL